MRIPLQVYLVGRDLEPIGGAIPGAEGNGAVLVRPDGHIAWIGTGLAVDPVEEISLAVETLCGKPLSEIAT